MVTSNSALIWLFLRQFIPIDRDSVEISGFYSAFHIFLTDCTDLHRKKPVGICVISEILILYNQQRSDLATVVPIHWESV
jgi:hypothetical protein